MYQNFENKFYFFYRAMLVYVRQCLRVKLMTPHKKSCNIPADVKHTNQARARQFALSFSDGHSPWYCDESACGLPIGWRAFSTSSASHSRAKLFELSLDLPRRLHHRAPSLHSAQTWPAKRFDMATPFDRDPKTDL